jgi:hypothetical protein
MDCFMPEGKQDREPQSNFRFTQRTRDEIAWLVERLDRDKVDVVARAIHELAERERAADREMTLPLLADAVAELREQVAELRKRLPPED